MGVEMHAFIEIDSYSGQPFSNSDSIEIFNKGEFLILRHPQLFDAMANGFSFKHDSDPATKALIPPRGLPDPVSRSVDERYHLFVVPESSTCDERNYTFRCSIGQAAVDRLSLNLIPLPKDWSPSRLRGRVINPNWHCASWLFPDEWSASLAHARLEWKDLSLAVRMIRAAMAEAESQLGNRRVRLVFWFDN